MYNYTEKLGNKLNNLLEKNYDAEKGFEKAADNAKSENLKRFFLRKSKERYDFGHQIKAELSRIDVKPDKGGSLTGSAHRTWMDVKALFSTENDEAMLEAAITGEKAALDEYNDVLCEGEPHIPQETAAILGKQRSIIQQELNTIKRLEDIID